MAQTSLRKVGGSVMLAVPAALLDVLGLRVGAAVDLTVEDGRLVAAPVAGPRYTMAELLAASDYSGVPVDEDWVAGGAVGGELV